MQRTIRVMIICCEGKIASTKPKKRHERKLTDHLRYRKDLDLSNEQTLADNSSQNSAMEREVDPVESKILTDEEAMDALEKLFIWKEVKTLGKFENLPKLSKTCHRCGISDRAGAVIILPMLY